MLDHGADGVSFETIVAAGANSAIPHHRPTDAVLAAGDFVKIDFGALVCGYHSDMTRTFVLAPVAQWQLDIYDLVAAAQRAGRDALRPGAALREVDAASRQVIADAGYAELLQPRARARCGVADPRSAGNQRLCRRYTACWLRGDRGARCLFARPRRCPHRGHAGRGGETGAPTCLPGSPRNWRFFSERLGVVPTVASTADFKNGLVLQIDGQLWQIVEFQHVKPGKGPGVRAHQAQERAVRQGRRQDLQRRGEGGDRDRRPPRRHLPVPRRQRLRVHGQLRTTSSTRCRSRWSATPPTSCWRACRCRWPSTTARRCTSSCR